MDYLLKSYRLDEDVVKAITTLKEQHGSANKGLRVALRLDSEDAEGVAATPKRGPAPSSKSGEGLV